MTPTVKDWYMYVLGGLIVVCAAVVTLVLAFVKIPPENHDIVVLSVGQIFILAAAVTTYFFGSSKSSADKTAAMNEVVDKFASK